MMNIKNYSFGQRGDSLVLYRRFDCSTPTKFQNPKEYYQMHRAAITLDAGWNWLVEQRETGLVAYTEVLKADGTVANRAALPMLIAVAESAGEENLTIFLKSL